MQYFKMPIQTILVLVLSFFASEAIAQEQAWKKVKLPSHLTWEKVEEKCGSFSDKKRLTNKVCKHAENRRRYIEENLAYPFLAFRLYSEYKFMDMELKDLSNGGRATLTSDTDIKLTGLLVQHYNRSFKTYQSISFEYIDMDNSLSKPLIDPTLNLWDFGVGLIWNPWRTGSLDFSFHYGEQFYVRALDTTHLRFDEYLVPSLHLKYAQDLFSFGQTDVGIAGNVGVSRGFRAEHREEITGNYDVDVNWNYGAELYARKQWNGWSISGSLGYGRMQRNTSIVEAEARETTFGLKIAIPMGFNDRGGN